MLKNYFKSAIRSLIRQGFYSAINITGLAVGIACCLMIILFVVDELSFDKHHEKSDRIYRVTSDIMFGGNHFNMVVDPAPMAEAMLNDYPEVEAACRFRNRGSYLVKRENENIKEEKVIFADNSVFQVFTIPFIHGDMATALEKPNTLAMSQSASLRHFGDENPIGKQLILDNDELYEVTGVYVDMPQNSHFHFDFLLSMEGLDEAKDPGWLSNNFQTYFVLAEGTTPEEFTPKLAEMVNTYTFPQAEQLLNITKEDFEASGQWVRYNLQPLQDIHLYSDLGIEFEPNGDIKYVYIFSAIAIIILLIACINFMNLSTARSANRAREVGVRKVLGSNRSHLISQFLIESILLSFIAMVIAVFFALLIVPVFNELANKEIEIPLSDPLFITGLIISTLIIGFMAGAYPSFFLSSFAPSTVMKGRLSKGAKSGWLRSSLVVIQFCASIFLIVGTMVIYRQLNFIQSKKLGFNKEQVIIIEDAYALDENLQSFKTEVLRDPQIVSGTITGYLPVSSNRSDSGFWPEGQTPDEFNSVSMQGWAIDYDYISTMGMEIIKGRNFSEEFPSDSSGIILNEKAAELFGFMEDPIGKSVFTFSDFSPEGVPTTESFKVVGIVKNFHYESLRENIGALSLYLGRSRSYISFRMNTEDLPGVISTIESKWKEFGPGQPFQYSFLDDRFSRMYDAEQRVGNIAFSFSALAIFVACLGLFGMAAFTAQQRTKEIGVRKVMGASVSSIVMLLSKEFGKLILVAILVAMPFSYYFMDSWLQDYQFRINLGPGIFITAALITLVIAWLTMSWQSIKAATANPVDSLRDE